MDDEWRGALDAWQSVIDGSWSVIAWFDTDTRRYILLRPNPPAERAGGVSEQARRVARYAALGEANKVIAARLGLSRTRVSMLLRSTLRKLGLRNKAQLVYWVRGLGLPISDNGVSEAPPKAA